MPDISVVIRTFNEERYLDELLSAVAAQQLGTLTSETVIVDSGSTDQTLAIAQRHQCRIVHIKKSEFTFGRSLNIGCEAAHGQYLVFISGHCIPMDDHWLANLTLPLRNEELAYAYGNQVGRDTTKFSEQQVLRKYFDPEARTPQPDYFTNNANAALNKAVWRTHAFDEHLTGLEDMHLAKRLLQNGHKVGYADDAAVYHIHDETWQQVKWRYEREALALQAIDPHLHMSRRDLIACICTSIWHDSVEAIRQRRLGRELLNIIRFRCCQYWGSYVGSRASRKLTAEIKRRYFYPRGT